MPPLSQSSLELADQHMAAGRLAEAEKLYRQILARDPKNAPALHGLGVLAFQVGQLPAAAQLIEQAAACAPFNAVYQCNLGAVLLASAQLAPAITALQRAVQIDPQLANAHYNLANAQRDAGQIQQAIASYRRAIQIEPHLFTAISNLGNVLLSAGKMEQAIACFKRVIELQPGLPDGQVNLGLALLKDQQTEAAIASFEKAVSFDPANAEMHNHLAEALHAGKQYQAAVECARKAISLRPDLPEAHCNLGASLRQLRKLDDAITSFKQALALRPDFPEANLNLGNAYQERGDDERAVAHVRKALALRPNWVEALEGLALVYAAQRQLAPAIENFERAIALASDPADLRLGLGQTLLAYGQFERGWQEHEWRLQSKTARPQATGAAPRWRGENLAGKRILLTPEQGLGDSIHFARFGPILAEHGAKVTLACPTPLGRVFASLAGIDRLAVGAVSVGGFDFHCPLMSVPFVMGITANSIPVNVPYLHAEPELAEKWKSRLAADQRFKVGLVWAGNPGYGSDALRSMELVQLTPLSALAAAGKVSFYSLQKGAGAEQLRTAPAGMNIIDYTNELTDFAETAGLIDALDLVISVDTSVAHLAGAMGRPVWVMIPHIPDFRWMFDRSDSPWYPTMRLFRQARPKAWGGVIEDVGEAWGDLGEVTTRDGALLQGALARRQCHGGFSGCGAEG